MTSDLADRADARGHPRRWAVPRADVHVLAERRSRYCVVIPVINEGERILAQLRRLRDHEFGLDVVVADGGSTDGSNDPEVLGELGVRALLVKRDAGKLSAQLRMGFAFALTEGYERRHHRRRERQGRRRCHPALRSRAGRRVPASCRARGTSPAVRRSTPPASGIWPSSCSMRR